MCKFCYPILGLTKPHSEEDCALLQASFCPTCGPGVHFYVDCPRNPDPISQFQSAISSRNSVVSEEDTKTYLMPHSNSVYVDYLKQYNLPIAAHIDKNHTVVEEHLQSRGFRLIQPIKLTNTGKYSKIDERKSGDREE